MTIDTIPKPEEIIPKRIFLGWEKPLLSVLVEWLMGEMKEDDFLTRAVIVVPTAQSGRSLREALALAGCGLVPKVVTPQFFLAKRDAGNDAAQLSAWTEVLLELSLNDARGLFPKDPPMGVKQSFRWAFNVARQLSQLQSTLGSAGKDFAEISRRIGASHGAQEGQRWQDLAMLFQRVERKLDGWRLYPKEEFELLENASQIVVAGVCDLDMVVVSRLQCLINDGHSVRVLVHAPELRMAGFDAWGIPTAEAWGDVPIEIPDWRENIILSETPALAAEQVVERVVEMNLLAADLTLGLCDRDLALDVTRAFARAGWMVNDPEGSKVQASSLIQFLNGLRGWLTPERPLQALLDLVRLPEFEAFIPEGVDRFSVVRDLEKLVGERVVQSANDLAGYFQARKGDSNSYVEQTLMGFLAETEKMLEGVQIRGLRGWIARVINRTSAAVAAVLVDDMAEVIDVLETLSARSKRLSLVNALEILIEVVAGKKSYTESEEAVLDLSGWMELVYEDSPNLLLLGLHEGCVPEYSGDDPFLPDNFREMLGMPSGSCRYARDSYLLTSFLKSRESVKVYISKMSASNDPNVPSRLLMRTSGRTLAERVQKLFGTADILPPNPSAWQRDWQLEVPAVENSYSPEFADGMRMLSPSAIRDYLTCPFRFFLSRVVKMQRFEPNKTEMDARDFGNLVHAVVEKFGLDEEMRESVSEREIAQFFDNLLEKEAFLRFGGNPNLAVQMQTDIARRRLRALARLQAEQRQMGWQIIDVELNVGEDLPWQIEGHPMTMMLDRVERHQTSGDIRVMDYKTSAKAKAPEAAHLENFKESENRPILGDLLPKANRGRSERRWSNLQLPLYAWFAQQHYGCESIPQVGYIQLPNATTDTEFALWEGFGEELLDSAKIWTKEAISRIEAGNFLHPSELNTTQQSYDAYAKLAQGNICDAFGIEC